MPGRLRAGNFQRRLIFAWWYQFDFGDFQSGWSVSVCEGPDAIEDEAIRAGGQFVSTVIYGRINREMLHIKDFLETTVPVPGCQWLLFVKIASEHAGELAIGIRNSNSEAHVSL